MTTRPLVARADTHIFAPRSEVWDALVDPKAIAQYMFGAKVETDWTVGGAITWKGEWQGQEYADKGVILAHEPGRLLQYSHFSPTAGAPDVPENHQILTFLLVDEEGGTHVDLTQDNNSTEESRAHSEENWSTMLDTLKEYVEDRAASFGKKRARQEA